MIEFTKIDTSHPHYKEVENLMNTSFPKEERRDNDVQHRLTDSESTFHCISITYKEGKLSNGEAEFIGFITFWQMEGFIYLEHFTTRSECRNKGFGHMILDKLKEETPLPIILEVEKPTDDLSRRRIAFYERNGMLFCDKDYFQPPYRSGDKKTPLNLMFYPNKADSSWNLQNMGEHYNFVVKEIHTRAYHYFE